MTRIQELMAEARLPFSKTGSYFTQELLMEKFAELIIDECIQVALNAKSKEAAAMIVMHFGVKE